MRGPLLVLTWIVATVAATGLAWAGVRSVVGGVAAPLPPPAVTADPSSASGQPPAGAAASERGPSPTAATPRPEPGAATADAPTVRTFSLVGGKATVQFSSSDVVVLSAVPAPGFSADVDRDGDATRVEFESDGHRSRLDAWWDGRPRHEIDEHGGGDDGDDGDDDGGGDD